VYSGEQLVQTVSNKSSVATNITLACGTYLLDTTYYLQNPKDQQRNYKVGLPIGSTPDGIPMASMSTSPRPSHGAPCWTPPHTRATRAP